MQAKLKEKNDLAQKELQALRNAREAASRAEK
jgi:hypothetical protein